MREKIIQLIIVLVALLVGVFGTLYFTTTNSNDSVKIRPASKNVTIKESDTINSSIKKIYNAVVVVEAYSRSNLAGSGSGFVYKKDKKYGYILTNYHVVSSATSLKIVNMNGEEVEATYLGGDSYADIAVIKVDVDKVLDVAEIGDSTKAKLGDTVFTVGTPVNSEYIGTVTKGIISGESRTITVSNEINGKYMMEALQTDASINPGNSGGPLVNMNGEVIGITSMKLVTDSIEGMGFAIPIEIAMSSVERLEKGEKIERPYFGVSLYDINSATVIFRKNIDLDKIDSGVIVGSIQKDSPAEESGLEVNDVILALDGNKIKSVAHLKYMLYKHEVGDTVKLKINRDGKEKEISLKLTKSLGD